MGPVGKLFMSLYAFFFVADANCSVGAACPTVATESESSLVQVWVHQLKVPDLFDNQSLNDLAPLASGVRGSADPHELEEQYELGPTLGSDGASQIKLATDKHTDVKVAVKIINSKTASESAMAEFSNEWAILSELDDVHVAKAYHLYTKPKKLYAVYELLEGGSVFDRLVAQGHYAESEAKTVMKQLLEAIQYLHSKDVVHRNLRPESLAFLSNTSHLLKMMDFRVASKGEVDQSFGFSGYAAPETFTKKKCDRKVDLWSTGVIMYSLLCGFPPFYAPNTPDVKKQIKRGQYDFPAPYWDDISNEAKDLVRNLLEVDQKKRISAEKALGHAWLVTAQAPRFKIGKEHRLLHIRRLLRLMGVVVKAAIWIGDKSRKTAQGTHDQSIQRMSDRDRRKAFSVFDKDGGGTIERWELVITASQVLASQVHVEAARQVLSQIDWDGSGELDYDEFIGLLAVSSKEDKLSRVFDIEPNDNNITFPEIKHVVDRVFSLNDEYEEDMILLIDTNRNELISPAELEASLGD